MECGRLGLGSPQVSPWFFSEASPILTEKQAKQLLRSRRQDRPSKPGFPDEPMRVSAWLWQLPSTLCLLSGRLLWNELSAAHWTDCEMGFLVQTALRRVILTPGLLAVLTYWGHGTENRNSRVYRYVVDMPRIPRGLLSISLLCSVCSEAAPFGWCQPSVCLLDPCISILSWQRSPWVESWYQLLLVDGFVLSSALGVMVSTCLVFLNQGTWDS